jgi:hypothetical protein
LGHDDSSRIRRFVVQRGAAVAEVRGMQPEIIPLRSDPLSGALDWARQLGQRAQREAAGRLSPDLWAVTAEAALARGHLTVVASLLGSELVPALGEAMEAIAEAVALASTPPAARPPRWSLELVPRVDRIAHRHKQACDVVAVAERRHQARHGGPPPRYREPGSVDRVLERVFEGLTLELGGRDGWAAVAERLGRGLCALVEPVEAVVERSDAGDLEGAPLGPLKQALLVVHEDLCEVLLLALARVDLEHGSLPRPRARATA